MDSPEARLPIFSGTRVPAQVLCPLTVLGSATVPGWGNDQESASDQLIPIVRWQAIARIGLKAGARTSSNDRRLALIGGARSTIT